MIRVADGIHLLILSLCVFAAASTAAGQEYERPSSEEWQEQVQLFNEGLDDSLSPVDDSKNGASRLIEVMKTLRANRELDDLAIAYEDLLLIDGDDLINEEDALRSEVARRRLELTERLMDDVRTTLDSEYFDFGIDHSAGIGTLLPHLSPLRTLARLLALKAKILIRENDWQEARFVLVDMLRLATVTRSDRTAISALVGASIGVMALNILEEAMTEQRLDASSAMPFRMATMHTDLDPYGFRGALLGEYEMLKESSQYFVDGSDVEMRSLLGTNDADRLFFETLGAEAYSTELEKMREVCVMLDEAVELSDMKECGERISRIMDDVAMDTHGTLARILLGPWQRMMFTMVSMKQFHDDMSESLRQITRGTDPGYFGNAMTLYERCLPRIGRISVSDQQTMEMARRIMVASGSCDALPESMRTQLQSVFEMLRPIRSTMLRAAKIRRCIDKSAQYMMFKMESTPEGPNVRGMQAAGRLLLTEAALGICQHEDGLDTSKQVSESLLGALGIAIHMADGSHLTGQMAATGLLEETAELLELAVKSEAVGSDIVPELEERLQRCRGKDLLNWKMTGTMLRGADVLDTIQTFGMQNRELARRLARGWSEDRLFLAQFYQDGRPAQGNSPLRSPRFEFSTNGRRGELHSLDHIFKPSEQDLKKLEGPHVRLLQLIDSIDTVESPSIFEWKLRSFDAYEKIEALKKELTPARPAHGMRKPGAGKMDKGMDGKMGH